MYIYLHVPFCVSRCIYCDFYVVLEKYGGKDAYVDAVCREIDLRFGSIDSSHFANGIQTLYVGGGTPSLLSADAYRRIIECLNRYCLFASDAEITLEANPGARHSEMADDPARYLEVGFNRVSVGVQSFNNTELKKLSRLHSSEEAVAFIRRLQAAGWQNISLDLMYGIPLQTMDSWRQTLRQTIDLGLQHISMYGLKIEENTPLDRLTALQSSRGSYPLPNEDDVVAMYYEGLNCLTDAGFERYEFSNMAQPGCASRHNLNYWNNGDYLALGVAAHGYWQGMRYETVRDIKTYIEDPLAGESALCPMHERLENAIIFGLRKTEGLDISALESEFGIDFHQKYSAVLKKYEGAFLVFDHERLKLTEQAIPVSNAILADFME
jgi:oxygen-independent coproporphyrinogen III oxidase